MKNKIFLFTIVFVSYIIIFLLFHRFEVDTKQVVEMIVLGTVCGVTTVVLDRPSQKLIVNMLKKMGLTL